MHAVEIKNFGEADVLNITELPQPTPGAEDLLVRVKATALNRADLLQRRGKYHPPAGESNILGLEIAGEVAAIGHNVTRFNKGDRIFGLVGSGGYADYCLINQHCAMPIPENFSFTEAAAIPEAFLTATEALFTLGQLQAGETILIHAGGSGVGTAAIQLAKITGAKIFVTAGTDAKLAKAKALGADYAIDYKNTDFASEIQKHGGVDIIIDFLGASYFEKNLQILKPTGRLICVGLMGGTKAEIDLRQLLDKRLQIKGLIMRVRSMADKCDMAERFQKQWLPLLTKRKMQPVIDRVFPFAEVQAAHRYMESNANVGKIIIEMG
jgi:tumor protein p53-inducible protein 3